MTIEATTPSSGGAVVIPVTYVYNEIGGVVLPKDSGLISVTGTVSSARAAAFAQLNVYLLTSASGSTAGRTCPTRR